MGKTGVGKSSLCNALFRSEVCAVNAVEACTRQPQRVRLRFGNHYLTLVDLPGAGESISRDNEYRELYRELMPQLDMVLWVLKPMTAILGGRAFYQEVFAQYSGPLPPVLWVLNQVDKTEPAAHWNWLSAQHQHCRLNVLYRNNRPWPVRWEQQRRIFFRCQSGGGTTFPVWWRR